eukprot:357663-Chlamydomonas_euryale.AAC.4
MAEYTHHTVSRPKFPPGSISTGTFTLSQYLPAEDKAVEVRMLKRPKLHEQVPRCRLHIVSSGWWDWVAWSAGHAPLGGIGLLRLCTWFSRPGWRGGVGMGWFRTVCDGVPFMTAPYLLLDPLCFATLNTGIPFVGPLPETLTHKQSACMNGVATLLQLWLTPFPDLQELHIVCEKVMPVLPMLLKALSGYHLHSPDGWIQSAGFMTCCRKVGLELLRSEFLALERSVPKDTAGRINYHNIASLVEAVTCANAADDLTATAPEALLKATA